MKRYTDRGLENQQWLFQEVLRENRKQISKWGIQRRTAFEWLVYAAEELGETAEAISEYEYREGTKEEIVNEAIQLATLALKIAEMFKAEI